MECSFGNTLRCSFDTLRFAPRQQCGRLNPNSSSFLSFNSSPILAQVTSIYIHIFYVQSTLFELTLLHVIQTQFFNFCRIWVLLLPLFHGGLFGLEQKWRRRRVRLTAAIGCWSNTNTLLLNFNFLEFFLLNWKWKMWILVLVSGLCATTSFDQALDLCSEKWSNSLSRFQWVVHDFLLVFVWINHCLFLTNWVYIDFLVFWFVGS